ncbi:TRAFAC clade GTPase domain-containing protein [Pectobacterium aroidearum]|uniref:TRAFAC clade GTPase domain-containing protein n=1 Tax=Pectobacterium aroidearum TaxID=1201031 RepID=UPI0032EEF742
MIDEKNDVDALVGADEDIDVFDVSDREGLPDVSPRWVELPQSSVLTVKDADDFLCWRDAAVVAIVGERNGGKTTLVTEMYSCFLRGTFADAVFCHSLSLMGFEKKCFQSRADSGGLRPETPRTSAQDGLSFFHLALANESDMKRRDLLISERAGEIYRDIRDRPERAAEMDELRKASSVVFIVDGERVASERKRAEAFASVRHLVRAMLFSGNVSAQAQVQLVTTKYDLLEGEQFAEARESLVAFERAITDLIAGKHEVVTFHTAARDPRPGVAPAKGLDLLLRSWLRPSSPLSFNDIPLPVLTDEFDRLLLSRGGL